MKGWNGLDTYHVEEAKDGCQIWFVLIDDDFINYATLILGTVDVILKTSGKNTLFDSQILALL